MCRSGLPLVLLALGCAEAPTAFSSAAGASAMPSELGGSGAGIGGGPPVATNGGAGLASAGVASGGTAPAVVEVGASVLERSGNAARTSHYVASALTRAAVAKFFYDRSFSAPFEGEVLASPLYWQESEPGQGLVLVATTNHDVHALDSQSGSARWSKHLGAGPSGIASTPVIDPVAKTLYLADGAGSVHALSIADGTERDGYPLALGGSSNFDPSSAFQRSALSLLGGQLYVGYDVVGMSRGAVLAIDVAERRVMLSWVSQVAGAGIGAPGGMASDGDGVLFATGRALSLSEQHRDSQMLLRLRPSSPNVDQFYPASWQQMNENGAELGASGPLIIELPGASPAKLVAQLSGDGHLYLLDSAKLGGMAGELFDLQVAQGSSAIRTAPTSYSTSKGTYVAFTAASGVTCPVGSPAPPGGNTGQVVAAVRLSAGTPPKAELAWCYYLISGQGAPASTTSNGRDDATVWVMDDVKLLGLDGDTGRAIFDGGHDISGVPFAERTCPGVAAYTSAIPVGNRMMIAAKGRLCAWAEQ